MNYKKGLCTRGNNCVYAHGDEELRHTDTYFRTKLCKYYALQQCNMGNKCRHAHGETELRPAPEFLIPKSLPKKKKTPVPYELNLDLGNNYSSNRFNKFNHHHGMTSNSTGVPLPDVPLIDPREAQSENPLFLLPSGDATCLPFLHAPPASPSPTSLGEMSPSILHASPSELETLLSSAKTISLNPSANVFHPSDIALAAVNEVSNEGLNESDSDDAIVIGTSPLFVLDVTTTHDDNEIDNADCNKINKNHSILSAMSKGSPSKILPSHPFKDHAVTSASTNKSGGVEPIPSPGSSSSTKAAEQIAAEVNRQFANSLQQDDFNGIERDDKNVEEEEVLDVDEFIIHVDDESGTPWSTDDIMRYAAETATNAAAAVQEAQKKGLNQISFDPRTGKFVSGQVSFPSGSVHSFRFNRHHQSLSKGYPHNLRRFLLSGGISSSDSNTAATSMESILEKKLRVLRKAKEAEDSGINSIRSSIGNGGSKYASKVRVYNGKGSKLGRNNVSVQQYEHKKQLRQKLISQRNENNTNNSAQENMEEDSRPYNERFPSLADALGSSPQPLHKKPKLGSSSKAAPSPVVSSEVVTVITPVLVEEPIASPASSADNDFIELLKQAAASKAEKEKAKEAKKAFKEQQKQKKQIVTLLPKLASTHHHANDLHAVVDFAALDKKREEEAKKNAEIVERIHMECMLKLKAEESRAEQQRLALEKKTAEDLAKQAEAEKRSLEKASEDAERLRAQIELETKLRAEREEKARQARALERVKAEQEALALKAKMELEKEEREREKIAKQEALKQKKLEEEQRANERHRRIQLERNELLKAKKAAEQEAAAAAEKEKKTKEEKQQLKSTPSSNPKKSISAVSHAAVSSTVSPIPSNPTATNAASNGSIPMNSNAIASSNSSASNVMAPPSLSKESQLRLKVAASSLQQGRIPTNSKAPASQLIGFASVGVGLFGGMAMNLAAAFEVKGLKNEETQN